MRYRSIAAALHLVATAGNVLYQFRNHILDLGSGVTITPNLAGTDPAEVMQTLYPTAGTDAGKVGQGQIFIEAPFITDGGSLADANYYTLDAGSADLTAAPFVGNFEVILPVNGYDLSNVGPGIVIRTTAAITPLPATGAKWSLTFPPGHKLHESDYDMRGEHYAINNLSGYKDESSWNAPNFTGNIKDPKYTRE
jgi:hypothetical protein